MADNEQYLKYSLNVRLQEIP